MMNNTPITENEVHDRDYYLKKHENKKLNNELYKIYMHKVISIDDGQLIFNLAYTICDSLSKPQNHPEDSVDDLRSKVHKKLREKFGSDDIICEHANIEDPLIVYFSLAFASAYVILYNASCHYEGLPCAMKRMESIIGKNYFEDFKPLLKKEINTSDLPTTEEYIQDQVKNKYEVFVSEVQKYGFSDLDMVKCLSKSQQSMLIDKIIGNKANYSVPMLVHIGFYKKLRKEYNLSDNNVFEIWSKALQKSDRTIKGQFNALKPTSKEDKSRYNSEIYIDKVASDYKDITATNH